MKYTQQRMCPFCDSERGINSPWGMHPIAMQELKNRHDNNHPENEPQTSKFETCSNCGIKLRSSI